MVSMAMAGRPLIEVPPSSRGVVFKVEVKGSGTTAKCHCHRDVRWDDGHTTWTLPFSLRPEPGRTSQAPG
jgi:hypothetical protein